MKQFDVYAHRQAKKVEEWTCHNPSIHLDLNPRQARTRTGKHWRSVLDAIHADWGILIEKVYVPKEQKSYSIAELNFSVPRYAFFKFGQWWKAGLRNLNLPSLCERQIWKLGGCSWEVDDFRVRWDAI